MAHPTPDPNPEKSAAPADQLTQKAQSAYRWWDNLATLNAEDPVPVMLGKLAVRVVGILVLLALSPFILIGFLLAIAAVA